MSLGVAGAILIIIVGIAMMVQGVINQKKEEGCEEGYEEKTKSDW